MTLSELTAIETAYHILRPLNETGRRRALQWLADALTDTQPLPVTAAQATPGEGATAPAPQTRSRAPQTAAAPATAKLTKRSAARQKPDPISAGNGRRRKVRKAAAGGQRPYRRMPDPGDIMSAYTRIGTISGLADHFDVPQYTATHWARRLREQGYDIGRTV
ncbi:MAG TPA: hypothetical protein VF062_27045 [Candidatus Limnocylindrales bacterium]